MTTMRRQEYSTDFRAYLSNNKHTIIYICVHIYISMYTYVHTSSSRMQMHHVYVQIIEGKNNCPIYMNRLYHIGPLVTVKKFQKMHSPSLEYEDITCNIYVVLPHTCIYRLASFCQRDIQVHSGMRCAVADTRSSRCCVMDVT